jgi:hypothetical protein
MMRFGPVILGLFLFVGISEVRSQWIEQPGKGWVQASVFHHNTTRRFDELSNEVSLFNEGGRSITTSSILTGVIGLVRGLDVWAQVPFHRLEFNDVVEKRKTTGIGDPRFHVRIGPELILGKSLPIPIALRAGVKLSAGSFPVDSEIIPLTEGQRDWELILEIGRSFWPRKSYTMLWLGYRWREKNNKVLKDPGDEFFFLYNIGGEYRGLNWKFGVEGLYGRSSRFFDIAVASSRRRMLQLLPSIGKNVGPGGLEVGTRIPVSGRNLPAGPALFIGYFLRFGL